MLQGILVFLLIASAPLLLALLPERFIPGLTPKKKAKRARKKRK